MGRNVSVRLCAVALAAASLALIPLSGPTGAATSNVSCTKETSKKPSIKGNTAKVTATLGGCVNLAPSGTNSSTINTKTLTGTSKTTWAGGKGTTTQSVKYKTLTTLGKCPKGDVRLAVTATTTGGTLAAATAIPKGSVGKSSICENAKTMIGTLEPGTKATF